MAARELANPLGNPLAKPRLTSVAAASVFNLSGTALMAVNPTFSFGGVAASRIRCVALTDNIVIAVHLTPGAGYIGYRINVSDAGTITSSTTTVNAAAYTDSCASICKLDSTRAICIIRDNTNHIFSHIISLSGNTITATSAVLVSSTNNGTGAERVSVSRLSDTKALCTYISNSATLEAVVLDIAGTVITPGAVSVAAGISPNQYVTSAPLSDNQVICGYTNGGNNASVAVLTVAGSSVSFGTAVQIEAQIASHLTIAALSQTTAIIAYYGSTSALVRRAVVSITGAVATPGTPVSTTSAVSTGLGLIAPTSNTAVLFCATSSTSFDISGATATSVNVITQSVTNNGFATLAQIRPNRYLGLYAGTSSALEAMLLGLA